ncbi:hypothetical protein FRC04_007929, partial [Tulasnella sp. 424]
FSKADAPYTEAKEIYARLGANQKLADAILGLAEVYRSREEYPKAKAAFIEAGEIYLKTKNQEGVEDVFSSLADLEEEEWQSTEAEDSGSETSMEAEDEA